MDDGHALVTLPAVGEGEHVELLAILRTCAQCHTVALELSDQHHVADLALVEVAEGHDGIAVAREVDRAVVRPSTPFADALFCLRVGSQLIFEVV